MPSEKVSASTALQFSSLSVWTYAICGLLGLCLLAMTVGLVFTIQSYVYATNAVRFEKEALALKQLANRRNLNSNERFRIRFVEQELRKNQEGFRTTLPLVAMSGLVAVLFNGVAGLCLLAWVHKAYLNLLALGERNSKYTPVMAIVWCLLPPVNFVMTFFVLEELWKCSHRTGQAKRRPASSGVLAAWWIASLASTLGSVLVILWAAQATNNLATYAYLLLVQAVVSLVGMIATVLLMYGLRAIHVRQQQARHALVTT